MKRINKVIALVTMIILTLSLTTNVYADALPEPTLLGIDSGSMIMIIIVLIAVGLAVFVILKDMHDKK